MLDFGTEGNEALESDMVRMSVLCRIATDTPARFFIGGVGDLKIPADNIETTDQATYTGLGEITSLPVLDQLINGQASAVSFTISGAGVDSAGMELLIADAEDAIYRRMNIGIRLFDEEWQPIGNVVWLWEGECSTIDGSREGGAGDDPDVRSVSLGVGSVFTARRRPRIVNFTDAHQRRISADDRFFDRIQTYGAGSTIKWP